jgi:hypothetical protein
MPGTGTKNDSVPGAALKIAIGFKTAQSDLLIVLGLNAFHADSSAALVHN